jgi:hypothetical protein
MFISKLQKYLNILAIMVCTQVCTTNHVVEHIFNVSFDIPSTAR